jgi:hypothetical protein
MNAVLLDIEKDFDRTCRSGLLYKFSPSLIKLIAYTLTDRKFKVFVITKFLWPQGSNNVKSTHKQCLDSKANNSHTTRRTYLDVFTDDTWFYATEKHERRVLCKLQRGLTAVKSWCERLNIKINKGKRMQTISREGSESLAT